MNEVAIMDPEFQGLLILCVFMAPFAIAFLLFLMWALCRMAADMDKKLGYKEE